MVKLIEIITDVLGNTKTLTGSVLLIPKKPVAHYKISCRDQDQDEQRLVGQQALNRALKLFNRSVSDLTLADWENVLQLASFK